MPPEQASERIRSSAIRDTLVAYLHDWLQWVSPKDLGRVLDLADRADDDEWRRNFRKRALVAKDALKLQRPGDHGHRHEPAPRRAFGAWAARCWSANTEPRHWRCCARLS